MLYQTINQIGEKNAFRQNVLRRSPQLVGRKPRQHYWGTPSKNEGSSSKAHIFFSSNFVKSTIAEHTKSFDTQSHKHFCSPIFYQVFMIGHVFMWGFILIGNPEKVTQHGLGQKLVNTWSLLFQKGTQRRFFDFFTKYFFQLSIQEIWPCCKYLICSHDQAWQTCGSGFLI